MVASDWLKFAGCLHGQTREYWMSHRMRNKIVRTSVTNLPQGLDLDRDNSNSLVFQKSLMVQFHLRPTCPQSQCELK